MGSSCVSQGEVCEDRVLWPGGFGKQRKPRSTDLSTMGLLRAFKI